MRTAQEAGSCQEHSLRRLLFAVLHRQPRHAVEALENVAKDDAAFDRLRERLAAFADTPLDTITYETAARFYNRCRRSGVAGSQVDFLICAAARRHGLAILMTDQDLT